MKQTSQKIIDSKILWAKSLEKKLKMPKFSQEIRSVIKEVDDTRRTPGELKKLHLFGRKYYKQILRNVIKENCSLEFDFTKELEPLNNAELKLNTTSKDIVTAIRIIGLIDYYRNQIDNCWQINNHIKKIDNPKSRDILAKLWFNESLIRLQQIQKYTPITKIIETLTKSILSSMYKDILRIEK